MCVYPYMKLRIMPGSVAAATLLEHMLRKDGFTVPAPRHLSSAAWRSRSSYVGGVGATVLMWPGSNTASELDATAAMERRGQWRWAEEVPEHLRPEQHQWVRSAGVETWDRWDFLMLDAWDITTNCWTCRYAAALDHKWHDAGHGFWEPELPPRGKLLRIREAKWRGSWKGNLVHLECLSTTPTPYLLLWRVSIWGCWIFERAGTQ